MSSKKETRKLIEITPHRSLMLKVGQTGYSFQEAISELIDNSIDARVSGKKLKVELTINDSLIQISDNGTGMNEDQAMRSIRLGFSSKKNKLGEFGMGMKTACSFLGKRFTVVATQRGSENEYTIVFDEDDWMKNGSWSRYPFTIRHDSLSKHGGTIVIVNGLKVNLTEKILTGLKQELSVRFGPFISSGEVKLIVNGKEVLPNQVRILGKVHRFKCQVGKCRVHGWWGYQVQGLNKSCFGFNTFKRGRLITTFDKIGLNPNQSVKQIIGEITLGGVRVSHDKRSWQKGTFEYLVIERAMRKHFMGLDPRPTKLLSGYPASRGIVEGEVRIINMFLQSDTEKEIDKIKHGDVIVTEMTRPHFILGLRRAGAIITDLGGSLCHAAIVAREFDIPTVVGTQMATKRLKSGLHVIVDANEGIIYEA